MSDQESYYRPIKRIRQACENCRRKKARCTGERPECAFCVRLGQPCTYSDDESGSSDSPLMTNKKLQSKNKNGKHTRETTLSARLSDVENQMTEVIETVKGLENVVQLSLNELKMQISGLRERSEHGEQTNEIGLLHRLPAEHPSPQTSLTHSILEHNQPQTPASPFALPSIQTIRSSVDLYFRYCHNQPYSLFHEPSFRNKIELNEIPTHLLFALLASTVRYSLDSHYTDKNAAVATFAQKSWKSIVMPWNGIQSDGELSIVQTILLLAIVDYTEGRTQASWIKVGLAIRLAQDFRLMLEPDQNMSPIQQEERRRVFWSFYLCDKLVSCGRERPSTILEEHCSLQLPSDENEWRIGQYQSTPTLETLRDENNTGAINKLGPFAKTIVIASLLGRCTQYTLGEQEETSPGVRMHPWNPRSKFSSIHSVILEHESEFELRESLSDKISRFCLSNDGTIDLHRAAPLALYHALFFLCQCLVYHPFLIKRRLARVGQKAPLSFLIQTFNACRLAAGSLSRLMGDVRSVTNEALTTSYDPFYGYCTMVAGVIHSMFLHTDDSHNREAARLSLEASVQNLKELSYYWKSCAMMLSRLEEFRLNSSRYASLVDPEAQEILLSTDDMNDLIDCLDYVKMSTTPHRRSASCAEIPAISQLPSPFFEELVNLLPVGGYNTESFGPAFGAPASNFGDGLG